MNNSKLSDAIDRCGSTAKDAGISFDELIETVEKTQAATERSGAVIGNALKTIFTRIQRESVKNTIRDNGIEPTDNGLGTLITVSINLPNIPSDNQNKIIEAIGGVYQFNFTKGFLNSLKPNEA